MNKPERFSPPRAARRPLADTRHGVTRNDEYAWLRAPNWQAVMQDPSLLPPEIRAHLEAENAYTAAVLGGTEGLQDQLFSEMKGRIKEDDASVPAPDGPFAYYSAHVTGGQQPLYCRKPRDLKGPEQVLIDGNAESRDKPYFRFGGLSISPDHSRLAWSFDDKGSEFYRLKVRDLATGTDLADDVANTAGGGVWAADGKSFFYTRQDENHRPLTIFRHVLGTDPSADTLVYAETDTGFFAGVGKTQSERFIVISAHDHETAEAWLIDAAAPDAPPRLVAPRRKGIEYDIDHRGDELFIHTNDDAEDYRIVRAPLSDAAPANWRDVVPHRPGRLILGMVVLKDWLVRLEREDGLPRIVIRNLADDSEHSIAFGEEAYALGLGEMLEYDTDMLRFTYSSMTTPGEVYDYNMRSRTRVLRKRQEVPSGHDPSHYVTRRLHATAADGETVPVTLLYRQDTPLDGSAPLWLYGYGSYGITIPAAFNTNIFSLADRGFVYALAHIRGGKDKGYRWYKDGKRDKKINSFTDFIAVARYLAAAKYTSEGNIVAQGGSAGGLLMGGVANMAPAGLFRAIIAEVPFVDALNTMLDDTLPLTPPEWQEWGNPIEAKEAFDAIAAYSPYDNVTARDYPHILAVGGLTDPRVTYWEPAKWVAKLRAVKTDANLLLLKTQMEAGHGGASGRFDRLKEVALVYAFGIMIAGKA